MIMKLKTFRLMTVVFVTIFGMCLTQAFGNGTVKKEYPHNHRKRNAKRHHVRTPIYYYDEECPESPCPSAIPPCNEWYFVQCGFYAGGQVGYVNMRGKFRTFLSTTAVQDSRFRTDNGIIGELLFGYRLFWPSGINLGAEVAGNIEGTDLKRTLNPGTLVDIKFRRNYSIVPAITLGRTFQCNWNFFTKVGLGISRFETKLRIQKISGEFKQHKVKLGVVPSMGFEYAINRNLSAIATVTYEYYDRVGMNFRNVIVAYDNAVNTARRVQYVHAKVGVIAKY
jgi:hypothetical protein